VINHGARLITQDRKLIVELNETYPYQPQARAMLRRVENAVRCAQLARRYKKPLNAAANSGSSDAPDDALCLYKTVLSEIADHLGVKKIYDTIADSLDQLNHRITPATSYAFPKDAKIQLIQDFR
jgi:hypothetical protein